jgi:hypothetical protein
MKNRYQRIFRKLMSSNGMTGYSASVSYRNNKHVNWRSVSSQCQYKYFRNAKIMANNALRGDCCIVALCNGVLLNNNMTEKKSVAKANVAMKLSLSRYQKAWLRRMPHCGVLMYMALLLMLSQLCAAKTLALFQRIMALCIS